ncbi:hypothetical protein [Sulfolobus polyhedral virus 1]|uniref:Uncharacterized protein n=1 Tax=Sulfolobus polyhedral virus 1 TaxID=1982658 RepID=A0A1W6I161_SPV1|nr:hypothetical protein DT302_gp30 [Sulfolobus polyhedral virus 1]ARM37812.1 hypothetical protein [Sulfolobus polyhedral virus 1]
MSQQPNNEDKKQIINNITDNEIKALELEYYRSLIQEHKENRQPSFLRRLAYAGLYALGGGLFGIALNVIASSFSATPPAYVSTLPIVFALGGAVIGFGQGHRL